MTNRPCTHVVVTVCFAYLLPLTRFPIKYSVVVNLLTVVFFIHFYGQYFEDYLVAYLAPGWGPIINMFANIP